MSLISSVSSQFQSPQNPYQAFETGMISQESYLMDLFANEPNQPASTLLKIEELQRQLVDLQQRVDSSHDPITLPEFQSAFDEITKEFNSLPQPPKG